jgi:opacity protein-like surface antigen
MRWLLVAAILSSTTAAAQVVPGEMVEEPKMMAGGGLTLWIPQGDADDTSDPSLGIRGTFLYKARPWVGVVGSIDYVFVNEDDAIAGDITYYSLAVGARFIKPRPGQIEPYGELLLGYHALDIEDVDSESDIGFRLGGGIFYPVSNKLLANFGLSYSAVEFDFGGVDVSVDAFVFEAGINASF